MNETISIVIPVLGEAAIINDTLEHIKRICTDEKAGGTKNQGQSVQIVVVDGDPSGSTLAAIRQHNVVRIRARAGRALQMNAGAAAAAGDILLFLHADTRLPEKALNLVRKALEPGVAAGAFDLHIETDDPVIRVISATGRLRSRLTSVPYGDQCIFVRKMDFSDANGYAHIPLMEDVEFMRRMGRKGRIVILPQQVKTSDRRWKKQGRFYTTLRNWALITLYMLGVHPYWLAKRY